MKRWLAAFGVLALAACEPGPVSVPGGFRDTNVAITSSTRFDPKRFAGDWQVIESFEQTPREVTISRLSFAPTPTGYRYAAQAAALPVDATVDLPPWPQLEIGAFGRLSYARGDADPIWVIWVDEDHRTAVLGTPSGRFGMIINRSQKLRADRLKAARDIMAFNGYDITQLRKVSP